MKKILAVAVLLLFVFVGLWTAQDNTATVVVALLGFPVTGWSIGLWLVVAFGAGVVVTLLATLPLAWRAAALRRKLAALDGHRQPPG